VESLLSHDGSTLEHSLAGMSTTFPVMKPGARIGPYKIGKHIGSGGVGCVFKAVNTRLNRTVAIKISTALR
jgi:serine/threonine protein kinase